MRFEEKEKPWPFRPDHITYDGDVRGLKDTGIITSRHLQGIQSEICHAVEHPTTIIEFPKDGRPVRTDSPLLTYAMHAACERFRRRNLDVDENDNVVIDHYGEPAIGALCLFCDDCHACIFRGLGEDEFTQESIKKRKAEVTELNDLYTGARDCLFEPEISGGRLLLQYDCPLLGYRELLFPIIFEGKVIAVFFVGQITLEGQQNFVEHMIESLPSRFPDCFDAYRRRYNKKRRPKVIAKEILREHRRWLKKAPEDRIVSRSRYNEIIRMTVKELKEFEKVLADEVSHQRIAYIRNNVSREMEEFARPSEPSGHREEVDDDTVTELWNRVQDSINRLVDCFSLRYALVFGIKRIIHTPEDKLEVVGKTRRWNEVFDSEEDVQNLSIDPEMLPDSYMICSKDVNDEYLECLQGCDLDGLGDFQLVLAPVPPYRHSSIAILVGYDEEHNSTSRENQPGSALDATLKSFDTLVVSSLAAILARGAEDTAKKQLQYLGHEAGQLVAGIDWLRISYIEDARALQSQPFNKIQDICQDLDGFIGQMSFIFDMASQMGTGVPPEAEMSVFKPFGEVLFKWRDTYRLEVEQKCLQIRVAELKRDMYGRVETDPLRPSIYADRFLFEQVVYNLVNNAEKYCYRGTKIDLDCKVRSLDEDQSPHVLTVTDYGRRMAPGDDVYLPFVRRTTAGDIEGLGLGLYIAWLIVVKVHGGEISHHCDEEPASRFNIPLIKPYIKRNFTGKDPDLTKELEKELYQLTTSKNPDYRYDQILAFSDFRQTPKYKPSDEVLRNEILKPTYKVTVTATIPGYKRRR